MNRAELGPETDEALAAELSVWWRAFDRMMPPSRGILNEFSDDHRDVQGRRSSANDRMIVRRYGAEIATVDRSCRVTWRSDAPDTSMTSMVLASLVRGMRSELRQEHVRRQQSMIDAEILRGWEVGCDDDDRGVHHS